MSIIKAITPQTTIGELTVEFAKLGVTLCQLSILPDGQRQCDLADANWARGVGRGATEAEAIAIALKALIVQIGLLLGHQPTVTLDS